MSKKELVIYWSRRDFRFCDNAALFEAVEFARKNNLEFLPLFILDKGLLEDNTMNIGKARRFYLSKALSIFAKKFENFKIFLGTPEEVFENFLNDFELNIFVNDDIEPYARDRDGRIKELTEKEGGKFNSFRDQLTVNKDIMSGNGKVYSVFTPFKKAVWQDFMNADVYEKADLSSGLKNLETDELPTILKETIIESSQQAIFGLIDRPNILTFGGGKIRIDVDELIKTDLKKIEDHWYFDEEEALRRFEDFLDLGLDTLGVGQVSHMSGALKWGLVSARKLKQMIVDKYPEKLFEGEENIMHYISELIWREFYRYTLYHRPEVMNLEYQEKFRNRINWVQEKEAIERLKLWITGKTGYAVVDAAMNQINSLGWLHNRSRMIVASILTKNLGVDWRWGQDYFRMVLVDLDEASNNGGWQWASSTGSDPKPIRIFNPYLQAENYDKSKLYQRKWLPKDYYDERITPVIEHAKAREEALIRYGLEKGGYRDF
jgi:deoxyribodipyrimidine photo-lyase